MAHYGWFTRSIWAVRWFIYAWSGLPVGCAATIHCDQHLAVPGPVSPLSEKGFKPRRLGSPINRKCSPVSVNPSPGPDEYASFSGFLRLSPCWDHIVPFHPVNEFPEASAILAIKRVVVVWIVDIRILEHALTVELSEWETVAVEAQNVAQRSQIGLALNMG